MALKWLTIVVLLALVGCGTASTDESLPAPPSITTSSSTTSQPITTTTISPTSTTSIAESTTEQIVLSSDGLGIVSLGNPADDTLAILIDHLGAPDDDSLYESPFDLPPDWEGDDRGTAACHEGTHTGLVCFDYLRTVDWDAVGLYVLFSDITVNPEAQPSDDFDDFWMEVEPSFQGYGYRGGEGSLLATADGITIGSTAADLMTLGDRVTFWWNDCVEGIEFRIDGQGVSTDESTLTAGFIWGSLDDRDLSHFEETGQPHQGAVVTGLGVGQRGSC